LLGFGLVLFRTGALVATAPILSSRSIPARIKLALVLFISWVAFVAADMPRVPAPAELGDLMGVVLSETLLGLTAGLSAKLLLDAAQFGGQSAALVMGFGFGQLLNPNSGTESSTVGEIYATMALVMAIILGVHREALVWLVRSVQEVPPGGVVDVVSLCSALLRQAIYAITLAVRVAYPLFAATVFAYSVLGLLGKASPQLSLSNLGFAVAILGGGGAIYLVAPTGAHLCAQAALQAFSRG
jgi:flagellar biosynthetic protein FliR